MARLSSGQTAVSSNFSFSVFAFGAKDYPLDDVPFQQIADNPARRPIRRSLPACSVSQTSMHPGSARADGDGRG
jgi:hypothetical protein